MTRLARGMALTVVALVTLVPIQASPASALAGSLDVTPETVNRITGSIQRFTATVTGTTPLNDLQISYISGTPSITVTDACKTDSTGACEFTIPPRTTEGKADLLVFVRGDASTAPCSRPGLPSGQDCDGNEALGDADMDDTDTVEANFLDGELDISKDGQDEASFAPGSEVVWTAKVIEKDVAAGTTPKTLVANVDAEIESGPNINKDPAKADVECDTAQATGTCELKYMAASGTGRDKMRGWVDLNDDPKATSGTPPAPAPTGDETSGDKWEADKDEDVNEGATPGAVTEKDITDVVQANISAGVVLVLSAGGTKTVGSQSGLTATLTSGGVLQSGQQIAAAIDTGGANAGTTIPPCTTAANGQCTLNYTGAKAGIDRVRATVDADKNGQPNEADSTEGVGGSPEGGTVEPDATAVQQITWSAPPPPPPGGERNQCDKSRPTAGDSEILVGTKGNDRLCGYGGNDSLRGIGGNDRLKGGPGDDKLTGGAGNDRLQGQAGKDSAKGGKGEDRCNAEKENKSCER